MAAPSSIVARLTDVARYIGWAQEDEARVQSLWPLVEPDVAEVVDAFYAELLRHRASARVIVGGAAQVARLKESFRQWLTELFHAPSDEHYIHRRWQVGRRHVEIGLEQTYVHAAMARVRAALVDSVRRRAPESSEAIRAALEALHRRLDYDLAILQDAYQTELNQRQQPVNEARLRQQQILAQLGRRVIEEPKLSVVFDLAVASVASGLNADRADLFWRSYSGQPWTLVSGSGWASSQVGVLTIDHRPDGQMAAVVGSPVPTLIDTLPSETRFLPEPAFLGEGVISSLQSGIMVADHPVGILGVHSLTHRKLLDSDADFVQAVCNILATAIRRDIDESRLRHNERLAGIGQMITGLAHESRNALQRMRACLEMLEIEVEDRPEAASLISRVSKAQDDLERVLNEVRTYAAPIVLEPDRCDLRALWHEAWDLLQTSRRQRQADLHLHLPSDCTEIVADRFRLVQTFRNFLENSLAACSDPVAITVTGSATQLNDQPAVLIVVRDNGPGLSDEVRRRLFDPFFTTKTKGTGLGMAIAKRVVDAHGGRIDLGHPPAGAEFLMILPISSGAKKG